MDAISAGDPAGNGRTRAPRELTQATHRERLIDAMAHTVAARGYPATSVADVLNAARVSRRTFYERFHDKQECFLAAYDAFATRCLDHVHAGYHAAPSPQVGVTTALKALLRLLAAEPAYARLGVVEVLAAGPAGLARRDAMLRRFVDYVDRARMHLPEPMPEPPALVGQAIVGGIYELIYSHIVRGATAELPRLVDELAHYAFMLLGMPRAAS